MSDNAAARLKEKGTQLIALCLSASVLTSFASSYANTADFSIPTASLLNKLNEGRNHVNYFICMIPLAALVTARMYQLLSPIKPPRTPTPTQNALGSLVFGLAAAFMIWVYFFVPPTYDIDGDRFSAIYRLAALNPVSLGLVFGALTYALATALAMMIVALRNLALRA